MMLKIQYLILDQASDPRVGGPTAPSSRLICYNLRYRLSNKGWQTIKSTFYKYGQAVLYYPNGLETPNLVVILPQNREMLQIRNQDVNFVSFIVYLPLSQPGILNSERVSNLTNLYFENQVSA